MKKDLEELIERNRKQDTTATLKADIQTLTDELVKKNKLLQLYQIPLNPITEIKTPKADGKDYATVLTLLSDVHIEHKITYEQTNGINKYTPAIAEKRIETYFINLVKRIQKHQKEVEINELVIGMLGDMVHGFIHEEYMRTNYLTPIEAMLFAVEQFEKGLKYIIQNVKLNRITIVCNIGNHSRTTQKVYTDEEALYSHEWAIYHILAKLFPQINWMIDNAYYSYLKIYDKIIRFSHGHEIKYQGGIGGIYVPLQRNRLRINQIRKADLDCVSEDTEILTLEGFKKIGEVKKGDSIYNLNPNTEKIEIDTANEVIVKQHNGKLFNLKNKNFDMLLTANHRVYYKSPYQDSPQFQVKTVSELLNYHSELDIPLAANYDGGKIELTDAQIELTGWIISEGSFISSGIRIGQKDKRKTDILRDVLTRSGYAFSETKNTQNMNMFYLYSNQKQQILNFVNNKNIPDWVAKLNSPQFELFIKAMVLGDGHMTSKNAGSYYSANESLIDKLQLAMVIHGYRTYKYYKKGGFKNGGWVLGFCRKKNSRYTLQKLSINEIPYDGKVWCLSTNNGTIICRRNGIVFITGNCIGHYHTTDFLRNSGVLMNGSVCGADAYSIRKGFEPEPPMQQFLLIDSKRGFTVNEPILLK